MSHFITFSYPDGPDRISVRLELDGRTAVIVSDADEAQTQRFAEVIDARDARRVIADMFSVASRLPNRHDGPLHIEIGDGADRRSYRITQYDLPRRGLEVTRVIRMIANDIRAGYNAGSSRKQGGPRRPKLTLVGFLGWSLAFAVGFVACNIIGNIALILGALTGPFMFAVCNSIALLLMAGSYHAIGMKFGEEYRGEYPVLLPAIVGTLPLIYAYVTIVGGGSFFAMMFMFMMPAAAFAGEKMGH